MTRRACNHLGEELERIVQRHIQEYNMSCAEVIGTLTLFVQEYIRRIQDFEDDESDDADSSEAAT